MLPHQTLPPLAHVSVRVSGVVPAPVAEVWKIVRGFGTVSDWMAPVGLERISSTLLVSTPFFVAQICLFKDLCECGGLYYHPSEVRMYIFGAYSTLSNVLIAVSKGLPPCWRSSAMYRLGGRALVLGDACLHFDLGRPQDSVWRSWAGWRLPFRAFLRES